MAEDKEVLSKVWEGKLPVCFKLAQNEWRATEPEEIYLMVPRQTYFPLVTDKVQKLFSEYVSAADRNNEIWLDYNRIPLKWHYPVGLLFDLYANDFNESSSNIPWCVNVHFEQFPEELFHCENKEIVESYFLSSIKEADAIKHKGKVINDMLKKDHKQLWYGLQSDQFDQFWSVNKKLMEITDGQAFKSIPFRIYQVDKPYIQKTFDPIGDDGRKRTLEDLFDFVFGEGYKKFKVILIQGVTPSMETPVQWLSEHLSYPDNFLHICVK